MAFALEKKALRKAIAPVKIAAEANVRAVTKPLTGKLHSSFKIKTRNRRGFLSAEVVNEARHASLIEYGHALKRGRTVQKVIGHVPGRPFMRPALEANANQALQIFKEETEKSLEQFAERSAGS